jgi:hypothetical protein
MVKKIVAIAIIIALGALTYYGLVKDRFAARSQLAGYFAAGTTNRLDLSHLDEWNRAAKDKYGPGSSTGIRGRNWKAFVEGRVVETKALASTVFSTYGVFMVSRKDSFPFELSTDPTFIPDMELATQKIKENFSGQIPPRVLEFDARDWRLAHCHSPQSPSFGFPFLNSVVRFGATDVCLIRLNAESSGTMVVGYAVVYGGVWIRPFSRRICRILAASWVESMMSRPNVKRPDYVGCLLASKLGEGSAASGDVLSPNFFEVREDKTLAVFN